MEYRLIHYHGTPITPRHYLLELRGRNFCVSFAHPNDVWTCLTIGQSVMFDSGAFTMFTKGLAYNPLKYQTWLKDKLYHPHWALISDVIGGTEEQQKELLAEWRYPKSLSCPVWHLHLSLDYLGYLVDNYPRVAFGSSREYWKIGSDMWRNRIEEAWAYLVLRCGAYLPNIHMLRAMSEVSKNQWPFASADSTNVARNHNTCRKRGKNILAMALDIEGLNPKLPYKFV